MIAKANLYVGLPLLVPAACASFLADFLNERRLKKFLANASSEEMAFYKMMQDDGYEITNADKFISSMKDDQRKQEEG